MYEKNKEKYKCKKDNVCFSNTYIFICITKGYELSYKFESRK